MFWAVITRVSRDELLESNINFCCFLEELWSQWLTGLHDEKQFSAKHRFLEVPLKSS